MEVYLPKRVSEQQLFISVSKETCAGGKDRHYYGTHYCSFIAGDQNRRQPKTTATGVYYLMLFFFLLLFFFCS